MKRDYYEFMIITIFIFFFILKYEYYDSLAFKFP